LEALREIGEGQYAAFVVRPDGTLEMRLVEVGLKDYVNAEILSGLDLGETVTMSAAEGSSDTVAPQQMPGIPLMMPFGGG